MGNVQLRTLILALCHVTVCIYQWMHAWFSPVTEVTISFNPTSYTVNEGETVSFLVELAGETQVNVVAMFQTRGVTAIGKWLSPHKFLQHARM